MKTELAVGLRLAKEARPGEFRLGDAPLTVLVGVTGVGKSTALSALGGWRVLPDRREITDAVMIWPQAGRAVTDREERFALTAAYRQQHPGGMAQALGSLLADSAQWSGPLVFDGLRGLDEVQYAARHFAGWRFVALGAPDLLRVRRLLGRADQFDRVAAAPPAHDVRAALDDISGIESVFTPAQRDELAALDAPATDIVAKVRIVTSERQQYDPAAAAAFLQTLPAARALVLDTAELDPPQVRQAITEWI